MATYFYRSDSPLAMKIKNIMRERKLATQDNDRIQTKIYYITSSNWRGLKAKNETPPELMAAQSAWLPVKSIDNIINEVSYEYDVKDYDIRSGRRAQHIVHARQVVFYVAREATNLSLPEIGRRMGGRDHTTVLHGYNRVKKIVAMGGKEAETIRSIIAKIKLRRVHNGYWGC